MIANSESILFVCTGNTCRSVIAEAFARAHFGDSVSVASAGLRPQQPSDARNAIDTLKYEFAMDASGHIPRDVRSVDIVSFSRVIALDKSIGEALRKLTTRDDIIVWEIEDQWSEDDLIGYKRCALKIKQRVRDLPQTAT
jgi:protein-tyrosine-phosphatase